MVEGYGVARRVQLSIISDKPGETGERLLKAFLLQRLKLQELPRSPNISRWREITMTYKMQMETLSSA
jgi:hypothetical protein